MSPHSPLLLYAWFPGSTLDLLLSVSHNFLNTYQQKRETLQPVHASDIYTLFAHYLFSIRHRPPFFSCLLQHTFYYLGHLSGCKCVYSWVKKIEMFYPLDKKLDLARKLDTI